MARTLALLQAGARDVDYFRLYHSVVDNPKFHSLPPETFRVWIFCLCLASRRPDRGTLPPIEELPFELHMWPNRNDEVGSHVELLIARKLITKGKDGTLRLTDWDLYQPDKKKSTDRVRKHRSQRKDDVASSGDSSQSLQTIDETHMKRVSPAFQKRDETLCNARETPLRERETSSPSETSSLSLTSFDSKTPSPTSTTPQPPTGGLSSSLDGKPVGPVPEDVNAAVDLVRRELGEDAARSIEVLYEVVDRDVGGRWDCFAAAVRAARRSTRPIRDIRAYLIRMTKQFVHDGIPPEPVKLPARASPSAGGPPDGLTLSERKRRTREAMASWPEFQEGN